MQTQNLDGIICYKPQNTFYLSGFNPLLYSHPVVVIVPAAGDPVLLIWSLRFNHAKREAAIDDIQLFGKWGTHVPIAVNADDAIRIICEEKQIKGGRLGYEGDFLTLAQFSTLKNNLGTDMIDVSAMLLDARLIKNKYDILLSKLAAYLANKGMDAAIAKIRDSEIESSMAGEIAMRETWAKELPEFEPAGFGNMEGGVFNALWCYTLAGEHLADACDCPSSRIPAEGEVSLPVVFSVCNGLHVENERSVIIGKLEGEYQAYYEACMEARQLVFEFARPGITVGELYDIAIQPLIRVGQGHNLPGRVGHGMGHSLHEHPSITKNSPVVLQPGMIFTVEPGLCFPGWGEIRHSDTVLVCDQGIEILTYTKYDTENGVIIC